MRSHHFASLAILALAGATTAAAQSGDRRTISGNTVAICNLAGRAELVAGSGSDVVVTITRGGADAKALRVEQGSRDGANDLRIEVPAGKAVTLKLAVGEAVATCVRGRLRIDVSSARVRARGVDGARSVDAGSGHVIVEDVTGDTEIDTGSGGMEIDRLSADNATFDAGSGRMRLGFTNSPKSLRVDAGSGGATLTFPASLSAMIDIETGSGGVTNDFAVQMDRFERRALHGKIGTGEGRISIETGSGGVALRKRTPE